MNAGQNTSKLVEQDSAERTHAQRVNSGQDENPGQPSREKGKRNGMLRIFAAVLVIAAAGGLLYWLHARHYEDTDDAQIDGNLSPIGTRINGTVVKVYVNNNQMVSADDPPVDLDPCDYKVALDQAKAQVTQAASRLASQVPNVPITEVQNQT